MADSDKYYSSISPSAAFILQLKAYTSIPFAKVAAALLEKENPAMAEYIRQNGISQFFRWLIHFENRYRTIEKMLSKKDAKNILEISSGYSFRGLSLCMKDKIHFIDTDLPELVGVKQKMIQAIGAGVSMKGSLQLLPLNALDEKEFNAVVQRFPDGPVTIVNEGLLMYLGQQEKIKICSVTRDVLQQRGGQWITADVYVKRKKEEDDILDKNENVRRFREEHHIEENKFDNYAVAEKFFTDQGFEIVNREVWATDELSCLQYLPEQERKNVIEKLSNSTHDRETWELKVK